jgi:hypothetical protein
MTFDAFDLWVAVMTVAALTGLLLDARRETRGSRTITVTSSSQDRK